MKNQIRIRIIVGSWIRSRVEVRSQVESGTASKWKRQIRIRIHVMRFRNTSKKKGEEGPVLAISLWEISYCNGVSILFEYLEPGWPNWIQPKSFECESVKKEDVGKGAMSYDSKKHVLLDSVRDPWHFGTDTDPDPRFRTLDSGFFSFRQWLPRCQKKSVVLLITFFHFL